MRYGVLALLCLATVIAYVQRSAIGVAPKTIEPDLGIAASGMLGCCMALGWMISPRITDALMRPLGWEATFALYAVPGLLWAVGFALVVPRFHEPARARPDEPTDWGKLLTDVPMLLICTQ